MFKYLKTIGAHSGAPEIEYLPVRSDSCIYKDSLCEMQAGYLSNSFTNGRSKFIPIETKNETDTDKTHVKCIRILPGMFIECEYMGDISNISAGSPLVAACEDVDHYFCCQEGDGCFEAVDVSSYDKTGTIIVTLHC